MPGAATPITVNVWCSSRSEVWLTMAGLALNQACHMRSLMTATIRAAASSSSENHRPACGGAANTRGRDAVVLVTFNCSACVPECTSGNAPLDEAETSLMRSRGADRSALYRSKGASTAE